MRRRTAEKLTSSASARPSAIKTSADVSSTSAKPGSSAEFLDDLPTHVISWTRSHAPARSSTSNSKTPLGYPRSERRSREKTSSDERVHPGSSSARTAQSPGCVARERADPSPRSPPACVADHRAARPQARRDAHGRTRRQSGRPLPPIMPEPLFAAVSAATGPASRSRRGSRLRSPPPRPRSSRSGM